MIPPKDPFEVYRVLLVLIRTIIKVIGMFISKLELFNIKTKSLHYFCFYHQGKR